MIDEFHVLPIPAYNMQSNLVKPTQYRHMLKDAVVAIHFTLKHGASNSSNTNIVDIVNMRVLMFSYHQGPTNTTVKEICADRSL
jgi:hypothetical protein